MKHLINRENYIKEYLRKNVDNENDINEGLLSTVFGGLKMLLKKDWANVKCKNPSVLTYLKDIDKSLEGYTMTKMEFSGECTTIRQNVANYFSDILDYKLKQIEKLESDKDIDEYLERENKEREDVEKKDPDAENPENKKSIGTNFVSKLLNIKDDKLKENLKKYKENIKSVCKKSPKLQEYADQLLNSVIVFVNDVLIQELEKKEVNEKTKQKLEEIKKKNEEEEKKFDKKLKELSKKANKANEEELKKLSADREKTLKDIGITPIGAMSGDKAIDTIVKQFSDMLGKFEDLKLNESVLPGNYSNILKNDSYIGIQKSLEKLNWNISKNSKTTKLEASDKFLIRVILSKINTVFKVLSKNEKMFKYTPSISVQAMMVALSNAIIYGFIGEQEKKNGKEFNIDDELLTIMTKCAIDSDATIGFSIPPMDINNPENGNFFVSIMNELRNVDIKKEVDAVVQSTNENEKILIIKAWLENENKKYNKGDDLSKKFKEWYNSKNGEFVENMGELIEIILKKAKEIKEDAEKARKVEAEKSQQESESNE